MNRIERLRRAIISSKRDNSIPEAYRLVDGIESTGSQFLKLGFTPQPNSGLTIINAAPTNNLGTLGLWGHIQTGDIANRIAIGISGGRWFAGVGETVYNSNAVLDTDVSISFDRKNKKVVINDTIVSYTSDNTVSPVESFLFARNDGSGLPYGTSFSGKVKRYREYDDDGHLLIDAYSVVHISTNKPGMYDVIRKVFLTNQGSGEFKIDGGIIETYSDIYAVKMEGNQWIDSGLPNTGDWIIEDEFLLDIIDTPNGAGTWILGGRLKSDMGLGLFADANSFINAYGGPTLGIKPALPLQEWISVYFSRTKLIANGIEYPVQGQQLIPSEYETNILLGKNQVNYAGTGNDPRTMFGLRKRTKITNAITMEVVRMFESKKSDQTGEVVLYDTLNGKAYPSIGPEPFLEEPSP